MKPYPYSFEEFQTHLAAMPIAMKSEYIHLTDPPTEVGTQQTESAKSGRIIDYFSDCYTDKREAVHKADAFMAIHDYIGEHFRWFKWWGLLKPSPEKGQSFVSHGLFRAVHFAVTKLGSGEVIKRAKIVKLARAFNSIYAEA